MIRILVGKVVALGLVEFLGSLAVAFEQALLGAVQLGLQETVLVDTLHFLEQHSRSLFDAVVLRIGRQHGAVQLGKEAAIAAAGIEEGGAGLFGHLGKTGVDDVLGKGAHQHLAIVANGALGGLGVLPEHLDVGRRSLLVGSDGYEGFLVVGHIVVGTLLGVGGHLVVVEILFNFGLDGVDIDVANDDDSLQVRTIPVLIETDDGGTLEGLQHLFGSDGDTVGIARILEHNGPVLLLQTVLSTEAAAPFLDDDTALGVDFLGVHQKLACPAVKDLHTHLEHLGIVGHIDVIDSLVKAGVGIHVATKLHTLGLQLVDQLVVGIVLRAVEGHMLGEVSQTQLVFILEDRAGVDGQAELHAAFRFLVGADVVGDTIVQLADAHLLVDRHFGAEVTFLLFLAAGGTELGKAHSGRGKQKQNQNKKLFLHFLI